MKKISTLLFATIISLTAMAGLNPYAYNLSSTWEAETQMLNVKFDLNDVAKKIIIYAVDGSTKYKIHEIASPGNNTTFDEQIKITGKLWGSNDCLPVGKDLTFAVEVQGTTHDTPGTVKYASQRPFSCHGVAVNNCQDSQDFGAVYVTEAAKDADLSGNWEWLKGKGKSLMKYTPRLTHEKSYPKSSAFSDRKRSTLEPHRVCVSDDGRVFVSSYNFNMTNDKPIVWELINQNGTVSFNPVIYHNEGYPDAYGHRVCGMDVKGSGNNIKILLCFIAESTPDKGWANSFRIYEYNLNNLNSSKNNGTLKYRYRPNGNYNDANDYTEQEAMEYAIFKKNEVNSVVVAGDVQSDDPYFYIDGFANVSYAGASKNDIILSIDYYLGQTYHARMLYLEGGTTLKSTQIVNQENHWYGGAGIMTYMDGNNQYVVSGRARYHGWETGSFKANDVGNGRIHTYTVSSGTISTSAKANWSKNVDTRAVINDMAMDCANNIYAISMGSSNVGSGHLLAIPMPYSGTVTTIAPSSNAPFSLPAVVELNQNLSIANLRQLNENHPADCGCDIDVNLIRPLQGGIFNTICLPFNLDVKELDSNHPYYNAEVLEFNGVTISTINNESVLELNFVSTNGVINHSKPYLIKPQNDIPDGVPFDNITLQPVYTFLDSRYKVTKDDVTYWGVMGAGEFSFDPSEDVVLILVDENRLAQLSSGGHIDGFRGFFYFLKSLIPEGTVVRLAERKNTPTTLIDAQEKEIDIQKFLRDGRVYIRMGDTLYNINGEKVK